LTSGNITELPVSVSVPEDGAAGIDGDAELDADVLVAGVLAADVVDDELLLLLHAVASSATGIRAAAVLARRILLATGNAPLCLCALARVLLGQHAGACDVLGVSGRRGPGQPKRPLT
jgi:hypothetical protein